MKRPIGSQAAVLTIGLVLLLASCTPMAPARPTLPPGNWVDPAGHDLPSLLPAAREFAEDPTERAEAAAESVRRYFMSALDSARLRDALGIDGEYIDRVADVFAKAAREMELRAAAEEEAQSAPPAPPLAIACAPAADGPACPPPPPPPPPAEPPPGYDEYSDHTQDMSDRVDHPAEEGWSVQAWTVNRHWEKDNRHGRYAEFTIVYSKGNDFIHTALVKEGEAQVCPGTEGEVPGELRVQMDRTYRLSADWWMYQRKAESSPTFRVGDEGKYVERENSIIDWTIDVRDHGASPAAMGGLWAWLGGDDYAADDNTIEILSDGDLKEEATELFGEILELMIDVFGTSSLQFGPRVRRCVKLELTEGDDGSALKPGESRTFRVEVRHRDGDLLNAGVEVGETLRGVARIAPTTKVPAPATFTYEAASAARAPGPYQDVFQLISRSKRGVGLREIYIDVGEADMMTGTITWQREWREEFPLQPSFSTHQNSFTLNLRLRWDGGQWVNAGSTYEGRSVRRAEFTDTERGCTSVSEWQGSGSGTFDGRESFVDALIDEGRLWPNIVATVRWTETFSGCDESHVLEFDDLLDAPPGTWCGVGEPSADGRTFDFSCSHEERTDHGDYILVVKEISGGSVTNPGN